MTTFSRAIFLSGLFGALVLRPLPARAASIKEDDDRQAKNSVYVEGLGPGLFYSINYDRIFGPVAVRLGFGVIPGKEEPAYGAPSRLVPLIAAVPVTVSYVGEGRDWDMFEAGAGVVPFHAAARVSTVYVSERQTPTNTVLATAFLGYRYEPPDGGLLVRLGFSLLAGRYGVLPLWPYASVGAAF